MDRLPGLEIVVCGLLAAGLIGCADDGPTTIEDVCDHGCDCGAPPIAHAACVTDCVAATTMEHPTQACLDCQIELSCADLLLGTNTCASACAVTAPATSSVAD